MILKMHVYSRIAFAIMIAFLTGSIVFMAFDTTPPYEYDESASFVVPSPANDGDQVTVKWRLKKVTANARESLNGSYLTRRPRSFWQTMIQHLPRPRKASAMVTSTARLLYRAHFRAGRSRIALTFVTAAICFSSSSGRCACRRRT